MRLITVLLAFALALALPAVAPAATTNAPPGNSGISQYLEVVPSSTGSKPSRRDTNKKSPLSTKTQKSLSRSTDGQTLSRVIDNTSPEPAAPAKKKKKATKKTKTTTTEQPSTETTTTEAQDAQAVAMAYNGGSGGGGGGSGIGVPLIALMIGAAAVVGGIALARRSVGAGPEAEPEL